MEISAIELVKYPLVTLLVCFVLNLIILSINWNKKPDLIKEKKYFFEKRFSFILPLIVLSVFIFISFFYSLEIYLKVLDSDYIQTFKWRYWYSIMNFSQVFSSIFKIDPEIYDRTFSEFKKFSIIIIVLQSILSYLILLFFIVKDIEILSTRKQRKNYLLISVVIFVFISWFWNNNLLNLKEQIIMEKINKTNYEFQKNREIRFFREMWWDKYKNITDEQLWELIQKKIYKQ